MNPITTARNRVRNEVSVQKLLHSIDEGIEITGLGRTTFLEQVYSGRLKSVKIGRRRLIPATALKEFVEGLPETHEAQATEV